MAWFIGTRMCGALLQDLNSCSLAALLNPGKRDRLLGVADVKSCSAGPVSSSPLYQAAPKAGWPGMATGSAGNVRANQFLGAGSSRRQLEIK